MIDAFEPAVATVQMVLAIVFVVLAGVSVLIREMLRLRGGG